MLNHVDSLLQLVSGKTSRFGGCHPARQPSADVSNYVVGSAQLRGEASHRPDTCRIIDAARIQSPHNQGQNKTLADGRE